MNGSRAVPGRDRPPGQAQLPDGVAWAATLENVVLAFDPRVVMAAMHTTMIRASITAYSTAVGPSSFFTNSTSFWVNFRISLLPVCGGVIATRLVPAPLCVRHDRYRRDKRYLGHGRNPRKPRR